MPTGTAAQVVMSLNGTWKYKVDANGVGMRHEYFSPGTDRSGWGDMKIPNNWYLTEVGDYDGTVWFATSFVAPDSMKGKRLYAPLRRRRLYRLCLAERRLPGKARGHVPALRV